VVATCTPKSQAGISIIESKLRSSIKWQTQQDTIAVRRCSFSEMKVGALNAQLAAINITAQPLVDAILFFISKDFCFRLFTRQPPFVLIMKKLFSL
jgi:hypothetical protein